MSATQADEAPPQHPRRRALRTFVLVVLVAFVLSVAGALAWAARLPSEVDRIVAAPTDAESPERFYRCASDLRALRRAGEARRALELWIGLYASEADRDWGPVLSGKAEFNCFKYGLKEGLLERGFAPWLHPGKEKAAPVAPVPDALLGRVLLEYVELLEEKREYERAAHLVVCLLNFWPEDSETFREAVSRAKWGRSF